MKRHAAWNKLRDQMGEKRSRNEARKNTKGSSPHEIIVQRLASEPDNKQTFKPIQPREFVQFQYEDFSLANLKKACAEHFNLPSATCDILVSNKGPSCTSISQIPHRKDKVYLVRFVVLKDQADEEDSDAYKGSSLSTPYNEHHQPSSPKSVFPPSISIATLLQAGKLVKPSHRKKVTLTFENFDISPRKWIGMSEEEVYVDTEKFSSGGFRDAYIAVSFKDTECKWVLKTYLSSTIEEIAKTTVENHCRRQVQMHAVARHLAKIFQSRAPAGFGKCFSYNKCYYTKYEGQPATIEEFVPGSFAKMVNNDGTCVQPDENASPDIKMLYAKAQCFVHFTHQFSDGKLMVMDIQGSDYQLYDPEIASSDLLDEESNEMFFCCGNCTSVGIDTFFESHVCSEYCKLIGLKERK